MKSSKNNLKNSNEWIEFQNDIEAFVNIEEIINPIISEVIFLVS